MRVMGSSKSKVADYAQTAKQDIFFSNERIKTPTSGSEYGKCLIAVWNVAFVFTYIYIYVYRYISQCFCW